MHQTNELQRKAEADVNPCDSTQHQRAYMNAPYLIIAMTYSTIRDAPYPGVVQPEPMSSDDGNYDSEEGGGDKEVSATNELVPVLLPSILVCCVDLVALYIRDPGMFYGEST